MAGLDPATQPPRVCAANNISRAHGRARAGWAGRGPPMV